MVNMKENFKFDLGVKGLTPRIDRHPISPDNIIGKSKTKVVKIKEMIVSKRSSSCQYDLCIFYFLHFNKYNLLNNCKKKEMEKAML